MKWGVTGIAGGGENAAMAWGVRVFDHIEYNIGVDLPEYDV